MQRPILCLDFDGVIHRYDSVWKDEVTISDPVTPGFFEWAERAAQHFQLVIYSSRSKNPTAVTAMQAWLYEQRKAWRAAGGKHAIDAPLEFEFASEKPPAFLTIDDRGIQFGGDWSTPELEPEALLAFLPWNKRPKIEQGAGDAVRPKESDRKTREAALQWAIHMCGAGQVDALLAHAKKIEAYLLGQHAAT